MNSPIRWQVPRVHILWQQWDRHHRGSVRVMSAVHNRAGVDQVRHSCVTVTSGRPPATHAAAAKIPALQTPAPIACSETPLYTDSSESLIHRASKLLLPAGSRVNRYAHPPSSIGEALWEMADELLRGIDGLSMRSIGGNQYLLLFGGVGSPAQRGHLCRSPVGQAKNALPSEYGGRANQDAGAAAEPERSDLHAPSLLPSLSQRLAQVVSLHILVRFCLILGHHLGRSSKLIFGLEGLTAVGMARTRAAASIPSSCSCLAVLR